MSSCISCNKDVGENIKCPICGDFTVNVPLKRLAVIKEFGILIPTNKYIIEIDRDTFETKTLGINKWWEDMANDDSFVLESIEYYVNCKRNMRMVN